MYKKIQIRVCRYGRGQLAGDSGGPQTALGSRELPGGRRGPDTYSLVLLQLESGSYEFVHSSESIRSHCHKGKCLADSVELV